jgi:hypothetical protein
LDFDNDTWKWDVFLYINYYIICSIPLTKLQPLLVLFSLFSYGHSIHCPLIYYFWLYRWLSSNFSYKHLSFPRSWLFLHSSYLCRHCLFYKGHSVLYDSHKPVTSKNKTLRLKGLSDWIIITLYKNNRIYIISFKHWLKAIAF